MSGLSSLGYYLQFYESMQLIAVTLVSSILLVKHLELVVAKE